MSRKTKELRPRHPPLQATLESIKIIIREDREKSLAEAELSPAASGVEHEQHPTDLR